MNENNAEQYKALISDIIAKQIVILGPDIAVLKARNIQGLEVDDKGSVVSLSGEPKEVLEQLIDSYMELSGQIVKSTLKPIFDKYPDIEH